MRCGRHARLLSLLMAVGVRQVTGVSITGEDWRVHFNWPDQNSSFAAIGPEEYAIRNALVARLDALQSGHRAWLATYTFSGSNLVSGGAGAILKATEDALNRGAAVAFVADRGIDPHAKNGSSTLAGLAARPVNPLLLVQDDAASGIMHHKLGLFDYGSTDRWVFVTSWNFTGGASIQQWNIALELRSTPLFNAYSNEFSELLAGRFHDHADKSHAHNNVTFTLAGSQSPGWVRFGPHPSSADGGDHAARDLTNWIGGAREELVFALNQLTHGTVASSLVQAADRGVRIHGVMPRSDTDPGESSAALYSYLTNTASYATTNRIHFLPAFTRADGATNDTGQADLVHAKWVVVDPFGAQPGLIHGSANWTFSALQSVNANDENVLFVRHRELARMFYVHFKQITGAFGDSPDFWLERTPAGVNLWAAETGHVYGIESAIGPNGPWSVWMEGVTGLLGAASVSVDMTNGPSRSIRAVR